MSRQDCRELIATCRAKGLRTGTLKGIVRALSTILTQAVEDGLLSANPALREHFPEWHPWLLCGLRTGMRDGELLVLQ